MLRFTGLQRARYNLATERQQHDHCPVRLLPSFTVKAELRKKMEKKEKEKGYTSSINLQLTGEKGFTKKENLLGVETPIDSAAKERCLWVLCSIIYYFHKILDQNEGELQERHLPVSLCLGSGCSVQYLCPGCVSVHPSFLLQQRGLQSARDTNQWPLKFQIITQAGQLWR